MTVIDYENIEEVSLGTAGGEYSGEGTIPGINSPMLDANTSVANIPKSEVILEGDLNVVRGWINTVNFSSANENTVNWSSGSLTMPDGTIYSIAAGSTGIMTAITYIYLDLNVSETVLQITTNSATCVGEDKLLVCVAKNQTAPKNAIFQNFGTNTQDVFITADNIASNSITANEMQVNSLSALSANMGTLTSGTITLNSSGHIKSGQTNYNTGTGFFMGVSGGVPKFSIGNPNGNYIAFNGSTISLNVPISYSQITNPPDIPDQVELPSYIKSTYIDSVSIQSPTITGGTLQTATSGQRIRISTDNTIRFYNSGGSLAAGLYGGTFSNSGGAQNCLVITGNTRIQGNIVPMSDGVYDLGSTLTNRWRDIYMSGVVRFSGKIQFLSGSELVTTATTTSNRYINIRLTDNSGTTRTYKLLLAT